MRDTVRRGMVVGGIVSLIVSAGAFLLAAVALAALISVVALLIGVAVGGFIGAAWWLTRFARALLRG